MSWALMLHPDGLECDTFVTHAWSEGVFEFLTKIRQMRPWRARHLYICFLANPQNADISKLLSKNPMDSPFADALLIARHFLVVPNHAVSIYTRLWCVFEIHLAMSHGHHIVIPTKPKKRWIVPEVVGGILVLAVSFLVFQAPWGLVNIITDKCLFRDIQLGHSMLVPMSVLLRHRMPCTSPRSVSWMILVFVSLAVSLHIKKHSDANSMSEYVRSLKASHNQCMIPHLLFVLAGFRFAWRVHADRVRDREADLLECETVEKASCSNADDESRIKDAIRGVEKTIDDTILMVQRIGWWSPAVEANQQLGVHVDRLADGIFPEILSGGCCYWVLAVRNVFLFISDGWREGVGWESVLLGMLLTNALCFAVVCYVREYSILAIDTLASTGAITHVAKNVLLLARKQTNLIAHFYIIVVLRSIRKVWACADESIRRNAISNEAYGLDSSSDDDSDSTPSASDQPVKGFDGALQG
eukprot:TRINITY_DN13526_c0_g1_i1.p1 TRINITY_DN13526_c0_g1~~TRINITY_DN13526_c0_g1_i1.p1  ORF type:complete len:552 (-),score=52.21 TRINITY_DN13526_c0_g1_i1:154-1566(-)